MENEDPFFKALRGTVIHLIKHTETLYNVMIPFLKPYDDGEWKSFTMDQKRQHIMELRTYLSGQDPVSKYFEAYPHKWSKMRFAMFLELLDAYVAELSQTARV